MGPHHRTQHHSQLGRDPQPALDRPRRRRHQPHPRLRTPAHDPWIPVLLQHHPPRQRQLHHPTLLRLPHLPPKTIRQITPKASGLTSSQKLASNNLPCPSSPTLRRSPSASETTLKSSRPSSRPTTSSTAPPTTSSPSHEGSPPTTSSPPTSTAWFVPSSCAKAATSPSAPSSASSPSP